jgi:hypothetical protein
MPRLVFVGRQRGDELCWVESEDLLIRDRTFRGAQILPRVLFPGKNTNVVSNRSCH